MMSSIMYRQYSCKDSQDRALFGFKMPQNSILEHLFFKIFLGGHAPDPLSISMLQMLIVLRTIVTIVENSLN